MPEIPEHLLKRSAERRKQLKGDSDADADHGVVGRIIAAERQAIPRPGTTSGEEALLSEQAEHVVGPGQAALDPAVVDADVHAAVLDTAGEGQLLAARRPLAHENTDDLAVGVLQRTLFSMKADECAIAAQGQLERRGDAQQAGGPVRADGRV